jgi:hypothetical protein
MLTAPNPAARKLRLAAARMLSALLAGGPSLRSMFYIAPVVASRLGDERTLDSI